MGWDEICDNQRWGIDKLLNGQTVYHPLAKDRAPNAKQAQWKLQRIDKYRTAAQVLIRGRGGGYRCQVDEFPMGNLIESGNLSPQVCRLVNGPANQKQGGDYSAWKEVQWKPCSTYRSDKCSIIDGGPPATWYVTLKLPSSMSDFETGSLGRCRRVAVLAVETTS